MSGTGANALRESFWGVGQLADRLTVNQEVGGSSPPAPVVSSCFQVAAPLLPRGGGGFRVEMAAPPDPSRPRVVVARALRAGVLVDAAHHQASRPVHLTAGSGRSPTCASHLVAPRMDVAMDFKVVQRDAFAMVRHSDHVLGPTCSLSTYRHVISRMRRHGSHRPCRDEPQRPLRWPTQRRLRRRTQPSCTGAGCVAPAGRAVSPRRAATGAVVHLKRADCHVTR